MRYETFSEHIGIFDGPGENFCKEMSGWAYEWRRQSPVSNKASNKDGWQKDCLGISQFDPVVDMLLNQFAEYMKVYELKESIYARVTKLFLNINPAGASNYMHHHMNADWSGAFFLQSDPHPGTSGDLHILNPNRNSFLTTNYNTDYKYHSIPFSPVVNRGLFFASHLVHYVDLNRSNTDRISIAYHIDASPYKISDFKIDF